MTKEMVSGLAALILPAALLLATPGYAAEPDPTRFQLERSGDHFVRLDKQTGAMSICQDQNGNLVCRMAADERAAYENELDRLSERVSKLEKTVASSSGSNLPSDADIDRTLGIMEKFMRGFMGMAKEFQKEAPDTQAQPQKT
ncbi:MULTISPECIES: hypothetical protein [Rhizobium]|uniref:Uncharacterized protein n=1 Tax=Rhizobium paranaense TaxID=1650438 RepID=A0A7W9D281_9HYPH|nr:MULTISPECIES: hypothetical protein [Rhizobium]MBB5575042.1 hypothetical protein [Rhizobium paranaense]PST64518.1 hypothetical protein C9E91_03305 [Rhizobium sp. SEMIA4064]